MRPNIIKITFSSALIYALTFFGNAFAAELNFPGFTGTANHTVTSGISMRAADYDCQLYTGYTYTESSISSGLKTTTRGNGEGCALTDSIPKWTDAYGNLASKYNQFHGSQPNGDDGSLNFGQGKIFDAKQKIFGSITGTTASGLGIDVSYSASYNPALDINSPSFKALTTQAEDDFEQDITLYDAYITGSAESPDGNFVDYQVGRFATNWGEATFIPVGANGLVTNALDLSKLRGPGASIREALMPTEQVTLSTQVDGVSLEAYYQFGAEQVQVDPSGTYFGSDIVGEGSSNLIVGGAYDFEVQGGSACAFSQQTGVTCDATSVANSRTRANTVLNTINTAFGELASNATGLTLANTQFGITTMGSASGNNGLGSDLSDNKVLIAGSAALGISAVAAFYSIVGLMAIFSASALSIAVMGIVLEIGKLITASWLYQNWKRVPFLLKSYLTIAVVILMFITSMGIFGYLSKAHIDQGSGTSELYVKVERLDNRIASERKVIKRAETQLSALDSALEKYVELGAVSKGLQKREDQEQERNTLTNIINNAQTKIDKLLDEKSEYKLQINSFEVEIGPLKYISALVYGDDALDFIDTAVRGVILILVFVFDPLAVLLIIAANISFAEYNEKRKRALARKNRVPKGAIKTTVSEEQNGLRKVTKSVNGVSMEYYE